MRLAQRWSARGRRAPVRSAVAVTAFAAGVLAASLFFEGLADGDKVALAARAGASLAVTQSPWQAWSAVAARLASLDLKAALAIWLGSLLPGGRALVLVALLFRGAVTGFAVAFLFWMGGVSGLGLAVPTVILPALAQVPALAWMGGLSLAGLPRRPSLPWRERLLVVGTQAVLFLPALGLLATGDGVQALALLLLRDRLAALFTAP